MIRTIAPETNDTDEQKQRQNKIVATGYSGRYCGTEPDCGFRRTCQYRFAGSNTTGFSAEALNRRWLSFELDQQYLAASIIRFLEGYSVEEIRDIFFKLQMSQSNFGLGKIYCSLEPVKETKQRRQHIIQQALFSTEDDFIEKKNSKNAQQGAAPDGNSATFHCLR